jgi:hypothetical protein
MPSPFLSLRSPLSLANSRHKSSGGSRKEDQSTYEEDSYSQTATHAGKLTGEGSHLGSATGPTGTYLSSNPQTANLELLAVIRYNQS